MKEIVVAGGSSFIGLHLIQKLVKTGYHVTVFIRSNSSKKSQIQEISPSITCIELDLEFYNTLGKYVTHCDCYIPLTWEGTKRTERNNDWMNQNSCQKIFESMVSIVEETGCKKIILPGSFSEYGTLQGPLTEDLECKPNLEYGKFKLKLYQMAKLYCVEHKVSLVEVRLFSVYGCGDGDYKMLNQVIQKLITGEHISMTGCEQIWEFIHINDVVDALLLLIDNHNYEGCLNLTTDYHKTLKYYLEKVQMLIEPKSTIEYGALEYQDNIIPHVISDTTRIRKLLNWEPRVRFEDGIKEMISYYQQRLTSSCEDKDI